jgi:hypothetical protein
MLAKTGLKIKNKKTENQADFGRKKCIGPMALLVWMDYDLMCLSDRQGRRNGRFFSRWTGYCAQLAPLSTGVVWNPSRSPPGASTEAGMETCACA